MTTEYGKGFRQPANHPGRTIRRSFRPAKRALRNRQISPTIKSTLDGKDHPLCPPHDPLFAKRTHQTRANPAKVFHRTHRRTCFQPGYEPKERLNRLKRHRDGRGVQSPEVTTLGRHSEPLRPEANIFALPLPSRARAGGQSLILW